MQRTSHVVHKTATYDPRVFAQPTRDSIAAALAAQQREREAFARSTGLGSPAAQFLQSPDY
jgi:hypothetical protein